MSLCAKRVWRASRSRRHGFRFGLLILLLAVGQDANPQAGGNNGAATNSTDIRLALKVCVSDEADKGVDVMPLLFNWENRSDVINQKTPDGCYTSARIKLRPGKIYFVAAISEDKRKSAVKQFTVPLDDKQDSIKLKLAQPDAPGKTAIEICAKDERGNRLPITGIESAGGGAQFDRQEVKDSLCYRVSANTVGEYPLSLTAQSVAADESLFTNSTIGLLTTLLSLMVLATLALTFILFLRFKEFESRPAGPEIMSARPGQGGEPTGHTQGGWHRPEVRQPRPSLPVTQANEQTDAQPDALATSDAEASATGEGDHQPSGRTATNSASSAATTSQQLQQVDDIKAKYLRFSRGDQVEHFYLTPSGASSASDMVEDAKIELLEQNKGSYVAFRSSDNEAEAWVFPMPRMHFTSETFSAVFPHLTDTEYETGNIEPKRAVSPQPKSWKIQ